MSGITPYVIATSLAVAAATVLLIETLVTALGRSRNRAVARQDRRSASCSTVTTLSIPRPRAACSWIAWATNGPRSTA